MIALVGPIERHAIVTNGPKRHAGVTLGRRSDKLVPHRERPRGNHV